MAKQNNIRRIFPPEVCDLIDSGIKPNWYAGSLVDPEALTPEFAAQSILKLNEARRHAEIHGVPDDSGDAALF